MKLVLFEDTDAQATPLLEALAQRLGAAGQIHRFEAQNTDDATYEERLHRTLRVGELADATLWIADRDLSKTEHYRGLSEATVRRVAQHLGVPECSYSRRANGNEYMRSGEHKEATITVSVASSPGDTAREIVAIAEGFRALRTAIEQYDHNGAMESVGHVLASLLGKPEYGDKISLYAFGDQNRLDAIVDLQDKGRDERVARMTCFLGYWLWDSVLRFPGVVVDGIAAGSYLNIDDKVFREDADVAACFDDARYRGPFADAKGAMWWRGALDDLIADSACEDGNAFARDRVKREVPRSRCCEDASVAAGYYCMLSERPVSLRNSMPGLAWFPRGADLARICRSKYEELSPWLQ